MERGRSADHSDGQASVRPCGCERAAHCAGRHSKTFETGLGTLNLVRACILGGRCEDFRA